MGGREVGNIRLTSYVVVLVVVVGSHYVRSSTAVKV
jgi:hypothetical protein